MSFGSKAVALAASATLGLLTGPSWAVEFASSVVSYISGSSNPDYRTPAAAVGAPDGITGLDFGFPSVVSPFSPAFDTSQIVQIGEGGQLTLRFSHFALANAPVQLGVFTNTGLQDRSFLEPVSAGTNYNPARIFSGGSAIVNVSADGNTWFSLGSKDFTIPNLAYVNAGPYDTTAPAIPQLTDYGLAFPGTLSSFDGKDWAGAVAAFQNGAAYSAGGNWLDFSSTPLTQIAFIQFVIPDDGDETTNRVLSIDAVSIGNDSVGPAVPVPEPASAALIILGVVACIAARRTDHRLR